MPTAAERRLLNATARANPPSPPPPPTLWARTPAACWPSVSIAPLFLTSTLDAFPPEPPLPPSQTATASALFVAPTASEIAQPPEPPPPPTLCARIPCESSPRVVIPACEVTLTEPPPPPLPPAAPMLTALTGMKPLPPFFVAIEPLIENPPSPPPPPTLWASRPSAWSPSVRIVPFVGETSLPTVTAEELPAAAPGRLLLPTAMSIPPSSASRLNAPWIATPPVPPPPPTLCATIACDPNPYVVTSLVLYTLADPAAPPLPALGPSPSGE